jgi:hypothetical protein
VRGDPIGMQQTPPPPQQVWSSLMTGRAIEATPTPTGEVWLPEDTRPIPVRDWDSQAPRRLWPRALAAAAVAAAGLLLAWLYA